MIGGQNYPWSVIVKVFNGGGVSGVGQETFHNPYSWNYWKREILAYSSGILGELSGDLIAPRFMVSQNIPIMNGVFGWRILRTQQS